MNTQGHITPVTAEPDTQESWRVEPPDVSHIITEDDTPVDNLPSEKEMRLLIEPLYSSFEAKMPFLAASNVGIFSALNRPPIVPDMFLSVGVEIARDWWKKEHCSYFLWEFGKTPDIVVEIVSNKEGGETTRKMREYAYIKVPYYVIYDPQHFVQKESLRAFQWHTTGYQPLPQAKFPESNLSLVEWEGEFEGRKDRWLRWADAEGAVIPTGAERAAKERQRAETASQLVEAERQRADDAERRAVELEARLRELEASLREKS